MNLWRIGILSLALNQDSLRKTLENFQYFFLQNSASMGLISLNSLDLAGDGTPVYTSAQERKTRTCNCLENGIRDCKCNRIYHQPDCDIDWIPIATVITLDMTYTCWLLLDSAHDAMPYYDYCKKYNITPFIDLNWKCGRPPVYKDDISINSDGIPLCPKRFSM